MKSFAYQISILFILLLQGSQITSTPSSLVCHASTPIKCNSMCVDNVTKCYTDPSSNCSCFTCADGNCANTPLECMPAPGLNCSMICWDGSCREDHSSNVCPPVPACPVLAKRCSNGSCVPADAECAKTHSICDDGQVMCADGRCKAPSECTYNGCAPQLPILCPDGSCVTNVTKCLCSNGLYHCFDDRCIEDPLLCDTAPVTIHPLEVELTFDADEGATLNVYEDEEEFSRLLQVTVPSEGVKSLQVNHEAILHIAPVPDSYLYNVQMLSTWVSLFPNIFSSVVNITVLDAEANYLKPFQVSMLIPLYTNETAIDGQLCLGFVDQSVQGGAWTCLNKSPDIEVTKSAACGSYVLLATIKQSGIYAVIETGSEEDRDTPLRAGGNDTGLSTSIYWAIISCILVGSGFSLILMGYLYKRWYDRKQLQQTTQQVNTMTL